MLSKNQQIVSIVKLVLTCEHGGNEIPSNYKKCFKNLAVLKTHRAYDLSALDAFQYLKPLADVSQFSTKSRLLVELNRSLHHRNLFSEFTKHLTEIEKTEIINTYYLPYRNAVESGIKNYIEGGQSVLHLSIHSFTPILNGDVRHCDIGLLFDSSKQSEKLFSKKLKSKILTQNPNLNVRYNYPYLGKADGFTTYMRKQCPNNYLGIEIEINQKFAVDGILDFGIKDVIYKTVKSLKPLR
jgi:predicted N-formylglutamate amidohydrolase